MTSSSRKALVQAYIEAFNRGDIDVMITFDQLVSGLRFRAS